VGDLLGTCRPGYLTVGEALMPLLAGKPPLGRNRLLPRRYLSATSRGALRRGATLAPSPLSSSKPEFQSLYGLHRIWFELGATQQYGPLLHSASSRTGSPPHPS
jgi:hypothetical protein